MTLREYRTSHDLTQFQFAVLAGILPTTVQRVEGGKGCNALTAKRIIDATSGAVTLNEIVVADEDEAAEDATPATK